MRMPSSLPSALLIIGVVALFLVLVTLVIQPLLGEPLSFVLRVIGLAIAASIAALAGLNNAIHLMDRIRGTRDPEPAPAPTSPTPDSTGGAGPFASVSGSTAGRDIIPINVAPGGTVNIDRGERAIRESPLPLHSLRPPPADFTGRAEQAETLVHALDGGTPVAISGLAGMGGIGKTALALVVADRLKPHYPDAQIYLELKGTSPTPLSSTEAMVHVIHAFEPTADLRQASKEDIAALYCSMLDGKHVLLLLDNALDAGQVRPLLPPQTCAALVTSRRYFTLPGLTPLRLDLLPPDEAHALVLKICPRISGHAAEVARLCGYVPLALRIAASTLAEHITLRVEDYIRDLNDRRARLKTLKSESDPSLDVEANIDASYALLSQEAQARLRALAVFPAPFDASAAASVWEVEEKEARGLLGDLVRYSLVEYDAGSGRYSLHDLVAGFGEARLSEEERTTAQLRHAQYYLQVTWAADALYKKGGENVLAALKLFDGEWEHIRTGQAWAAAHVEGSAEAQRLCSEYPNAAIYCLDLRLRARGRIGWLEAAAAAARQLGNKGGEGAHLGNLGLAYWNLGEVRKAIEYHEQALTIHRAIGDKRAEGQALGNLGIAYKDLGEVRKAIEYHEQALAIAREIGDKRVEGNQLGNLGTAYARLGEVRKAIEYYERVLAIAREMGDRRSEGNALSGLGNAYYSLGEVRKAIEYYEQQLAITREIGDRRGEGAALGNLGSAYYSLGEVRKAIEYYEQALAIDRAIGDRRGEGADLGNLGIAYRQLGEVRKAIEYYEQALAIHREIGDKQGEGNSLGNLGNAYADLGEVRRAIEYYEQQLAITREIGDRRGEGNALSGLGNAYADLGEVRKAIEYYEQALAIRREIGDRRGEGNDLFNLSLAHEQLGDRARALQCAEDALAIYVAIEDPSVDETRKRVERLKGSG